MIINQLKTLVQNDLDAVNTLIIEKIQSQIGLVDDLSHHIIESGGKRLRPLLVLLASHACQYQGKDHIVLAAMIEFFHTATLLHDDVVDDSTLRRGRETANTIWGSKASILVGDYLFTQSVQLMVEVQNWPIVHLLAETSHQISSGEIKQLINRHNPLLSTSDYLDVIRGKTALLFAAAARMGALLTHQSEAINEAFYAYGLHLGNAFQLIDDALDYSADTLVLGKNNGDDLAEGKITMPLIYALQQGTDSEKKLIKQSLKEGGLAHFEEVCSIIKKTNAIEYTRQYAANEIEFALSALHRIPDSIYSEALCSLAHYAIDRNH